MKQILYVLLDNYADHEMAFFGVICLITSFSNLP